MTNASSRLSVFNSIEKECDELYRDVAKTVGLPESAFWILYSLRVEEAPLTQSDICSLLCEPKQTVNSALKKLEADGYIELLSGQDRRSKQVSLTSSGISLAERTVDRVIRIENAAFSNLTVAEQEMTIVLLRKYTDLLKSNMQALAGEEAASE